MKANLYLVGVGGGAQAVETSQPRRENRSRVRVICREAMDVAPGEGRKADRERRDGQKRMKTEFWDLLTFLRRKEVRK